MTNDEERNFRITGKLHAAPYEHHRTVHPLDIPPGDLPPEGALVRSLRVIDAVLDDPQFRKDIGKD